MKLQTITSYQHFNFLKCIAYKLILKTEMNVIQNEHLNIHNCFHV